MIPPKASTELLHCLGSNEYPFNHYNRITYTYTYALAGAVTPSPLADAPIIEGLVCVGVQSSIHHAADPTVANEPNTVNS